MQRVHAATLRWNLRAIDAVVIALTFVAVALTREAFGRWWPMDIVPGAPILQKVTLQNQLHLLVLVVPAWIAALQVTGAYDDDLRRIRRDLLFIRIVRAVVYATFGLLGLVFILSPSSATSRSLLVSFSSTTILTLFWARVAKMTWFPGRDDKPWNVLVIGSTAEAEPFIDALDRRVGMGYRVAGVIRPDDEDVTSVAGIKVLGTISQLPAVLQRERIAQVFMTGRTWSTRTLRQVADACEEIGVTFSMDANFLGLSVARAEVHEFEGWNVLTFSSTPTDADALVVKRAIDLVGGAVALILFSPVYLLVALAIKLEDGGPIFFTQERCGIFGHTFPMYKFRSMVVDAEARKAALAAQNEMSGPVFKMQQDPRITRVGRFIRKTSLDELPQFWNVLRGEMSLVGPRPPIPSEVAHYERWQMRRLSMKPGITCIWQVSGRNHVDFATWMRLDLEYIDNWSLFLDIKLLLRTIPAVLSGSGAR
jgi:exopolysaccharide biosynthesis polyprenyl glycosylphosphotransferase